MELAPRTSCTIIPRTLVSHVLVDISWMILSKTSPPNGNGFPKKWYHLRFRCVCQDFATAFHLEPSAFVTRNGCSNSYQRRWFLDFLQRHHSSALHHRRNGYNWRVWSDHAKTLARRRLWCYLSTVWTRWESICQGTWRDQGQFELGRQFWVCR